MRIFPSKGLCGFREPLEPSIRATWAMLSQREVARTWGVGRTTIQRAIKSGKLSVSADGTLHPSEVVRAFGEPAGHPRDRPSRPDDATMGQVEGQGVEVALRAENAALKAQLEAKDALLAAKEAHLADLGQALRLLKGPEERPRKSFWAKLTGA